MMVTVRTQRALEFACHSKACAPPPAGKGGSSKGGASGSSSSAAQAAARARVDRAMGIKPQQRSLMDIAARRAKAPIARDISTVGIKSAISRDGKDQAMVDLSRRLT